MSQVDAILANATAIETHGKILKDKGLCALAAAYIERAAKLRAEAGMHQHPMAIAA